MDNQHKHITGYRDLTQQEIELMNGMKGLAVMVGGLFTALEDAAAIVAGKKELASIEDAGLREEVEKVVGQMKAGVLTIDPRWLATAKTDLQKGFMALTRAVARPTTF